MTKELKNIEASVKGRLYNLAKKEKLNFDFVLLLFMQERLLYRLSISKYNRKFILKGGLLILSATNFKTKEYRGQASQIHKIYKNMILSSNLFGELIKM